MYPESLKQKIVFNLILTVWILCISLSCSLPFPFALRLSLPFLLFPLSHSLSFSLFRSCFYGAIGYLIVSPVPPPAAVAGLIAAGRFRAIRTTGGALALLYKSSKPR